MKLWENIKYRQYLIIGGVIMAALAYFTFSNIGLLKRFKLEKRKIQLQEFIVREMKIQDSLKQAINLLKYDSTEIERIAREKYGMAKAGEKVYIIKDMNQNKTNK
jgi:cell division protein FtsB